MMQPNFGVDLYLFDFSRVAAPASRQPVGCMMQPRCGRPGIHAPKTFKGGRLILFPAGMHFLRGRLKSPI